jgi:hypothetical protein
MTDAGRALELLVRETREHGDDISWAAKMISESGIAPQDAHFFVETWSAAAATIGSEILSRQQQPSCSFCLKTNRDVRAMVTSPNANICDECSEIIARTLAVKQGTGKLLTWIRRHL